MAEVFGALLSKSYQGSLLEGVHVKPNKLKISHLQFVDDTLIMCRPSEDQLMYLRCVVRCFEAVSRLKVNLHKSRIFGVGQVNNFGRLADCLGCSVGSLPTSYLGLPFGASYKSTTPWNIVVSQIQKRLAGWKGSPLSKERKVMLIKSMLTSLPTYFLSLFAIPASVEKRIE